MKRLIGAALVVTLILPVAPVLAGDTFHALSRLPAAQASLTPIDEAQLAAIEGGQEGVIQRNIAIVTVTQSNYSTIGSGNATVVQQNSANVYIAQQNSANVR